MSETFELKCPCCTAVLIVERRTGQIIETRKPIVPKEESTGDRWQDARKRVDEAHERIEEKVEAAKAAQKAKLSKLDALFQERKKEIAESGEPIERPENWLDQQ